MKRFIFLFIIILSCSLFQTKRIGIESYLPRETDVPGWKKIKGPIVNKKFPSPYAKESASITFELYSNKEISLRVRVLHTHSIVYSFMFFSQERRRASSRNFTNTSFYSDRGYFYYNGRYVISITGDNREDRLLGEIKQFISAQESIFRDYVNNESLSPYSRLMSDKKNDFSLLYKTDCLSITSKPFHFYSRYIFLSDNKYDIFYRPSSKEKAKNFFNSLLKDTSRGYTFTQGGDLQVCFRRYKEKYLFVAQYGKWIFGVFNAESMETGKDIINLLQKKIKDFK